MVINVLRLMVLQLGNHIFPSDSDAIRATGSIRLRSRSGSLFAQAQNHLPKSYERNEMCCAVHKIRLLQLAVNVASLRHGSGTALMDLIPQLQVMQCTIIVRSSCEKSVKQK